MSRRIAPLVHGMDVLNLKLKALGSRRFRQCCVRAELAAARDPPHQSCRPRTCCLTRSNNGATHLLLQFWGLQSSSAYAAHVQETRDCRRPLQSLPVRASVLARPHNPNLSLISRPRTAVQLRTQAHHVYLTQNPYSKPHEHLQDLNVTVETLRVPHTLLPQHLQDFAHFQGLPSQPRSDLWLLGQQIQSCVRGVATWHRWCTRDKASSRIP